MKQQTQRRLLEIQLHDWLPGEYWRDPDFVQRRLHPEIQQYMSCRLLFKTEVEWPGKELGIFDWCKLSSGYGAVAVGYKKTLQGLKFFVHHYD